jgi:NADPH-dependent 7-cyano-7-deazaguanine reductase QueF-like protein
VHEHLPLGRTVAVPDAHAPAILQGIERAYGRMPLGIPVDPLPFHGEDVWTAYELSWLSPRGTPRVGIGVLRVPCSTPRVVESKSLKLYLGSLNQERLAGPGEFEALVRREVGRVVGAYPSRSRSTLNWSAGRSRCATRRTRASPCGSMRWIWTSSATGTRWLRSC